MLMERYKRYIRKWEIISEPGANKYRNFSCVYAILNKLTGKIYIGGTTNLFKRIPKHKYRLHLNKHENAHLQSSYNKYGKENFEWYVVEKCKEDNVMESEQKYLDLFRSYEREIGYNIQEEAECRRHTQETIDKIREKRKLQKPTFLGRKHTEKSREKMRLSHIGKVFSHMHRPMSEETKRKLSEKLKGRIITQKMRDKISKTMSGRPAHNKGTKDSEETRLKKKIAQQSRRLRDKEHT